MFRLRVTRDKLPGLAAWRRACGGRTPATASALRDTFPRLAAWRRYRERQHGLSPAAQRLGVLVMLGAMAVWTVGSASSLGEWRPSLSALVCVGVLFVGAAVLARVNRSTKKQRSRASIRGLVAWLEGCPHWFEGVVAGLVGLGLLWICLCRPLGILDEGAGLRVLRFGFDDPLMVFMFGSLALLLLLQMHRSGLRASEP